MYNLTASLKCVLLIGEFKRFNQNSYVESDVVKLGKQMRVALNTMISNGVSAPRVCGIVNEGTNISTFVMDVTSPRIYRMITVAKTKLVSSSGQM